MACNDIAEIRSEIKSAWEKHGLEKTEPGQQTNLSSDDFNDSTGYWVTGKRNKPPRWLFRLKRQDDDLIAENAGEAFGYANSSNRDRISVIITRAMAVFDEESEGYRLFEDWEWCLLVLLGEPLRVAHSGMRIDGTPRRLRYGNDSRGWDELDVVGLHLYPLCDPEETATIGETKTTYKAATEALGRMLKADDTGSAESSQDLFG